MLKGLLEFCSDLQSYERHSRIVLKQQDHSRTDAGEDPTL